MKKIKLLSFGSLDISDLKKTDIKNNFFISIEFDIGKNIKEGQDTFMFFLSDIGGLEKYLENEFKHNESIVLNNIIVVKEYSYEFILNYLDLNITSKLKELSEKDIWKYLNLNYLYIDD